LTDPRDKQKTTKHKAFKGRNTFLIDGQRFAERCLMPESALKAKLYWNKNSAYGSSVRWDIIDLIPRGPHKILDIGCGAGRTVTKLRELGKAREILGIEINENATHWPHGLDKLYIGDVETMEVPYSEKRFDYILFGDVLEHLIDPGNVLSTYASLLKDDGYIIASVPNVKFLDILLRLVFLDEFRYDDCGILDRSHLRFFTKSEAIKMFEGANLEVVDVIHIPYRQDVKRARDHLFHLVRRLLSRSSFSAVQYIIKAKKATSST
jgi:2-polyprenyl-3-methyl-5-hydroxy-6-metoxy-1,4-benzoquinol methylase